MKECQKCGHLVLEADQICHKEYGGCGRKLRSVPLGEWWDLVGSPAFWIAADLGALYGLVRFVRWAWFN